MRYTSDKPSTGAGFLPSTVLRREWNIMGHWSEMNWTKSATHGVWSALAVVTSWGLGERKWGKPTKVLQRPIFSERGLHKVLNYWNVLDVWGLLWFTPISRQTQTSMAIPGTHWLEVPTISKAYVLAYLGWYTSKIWPYVVKYLHFRFLKFPLKTDFDSPSWVVSTQTWFVSCYSSSFSWICFPNAHSQGATSRSI